MPIMIFGNRVIRNCKKANSDTAKENVGDDTMTFLLSDILCLVTTLQIFCHMVFSYAHIKWANV